MRRTKATLPTLLLAFTIPFPFGTAVYGFVLITEAVAQNDGPPGPGWREIKPPRSLLQRWREGESTSRSPQQPRPKPSKTAPR